MPNLSEYTEIKKMVAKMIVSDRTCVDLITNTNNKEPLPAARLIQTKNAINQIHLYDFIPGVTESAKVHVCVEVYDFPPTSVAVGIYELCIYCIVPDELMAMDGAVRRDELVAAIDTTRLVFGLARLSGCRASVRSQSRGSGAVPCVIE